MSRAPVAIRKPHYVLLKNALNQPLEISTINDRGRVVAQRVGPKSTTRPIAEDRITDFTRGLIAKGHLKSV